MAGLQSIERAANVLGSLPLYSQVPGGRRTVVVGLFGLAAKLTTEIAKPTINIINRGGIAGSETNGVQGGDTILEQIHVDYPDAKILPFKLSAYLLDYTHTLQTYALLDKGKLRFIVALVEASPQGKILAGSTLIDPFSDTKTSSVSDNFGYGVEFGFNFWQIRDPFVIIVPNNNASNSGRTLPPVMPHHRP